MGSSTTEPVEVTSARTIKALLGTLLVHYIERLAYRADKAGRRPVIILLQRKYDVAPAAVAVVA